MTTPPEIYESHDAGRFCACVSKHSPTVTHIIRHHIWPMGMGGPDTPENTIWICPTTHENVHVLLRAYVRYEGRPPWKEDGKWMGEYRFGSYVRELARGGWERSQQW